MDELLERGPIMCGPLHVPPIDAALEWLRSLGDPAVDLRLAIEFDGAGPDEIDDLRADANATDLVRSAMLTQRIDGSWGSRNVARQRISATLRMVQLLADVGAGHRPRVGAAIDFLEGCAHLDDGVFSINGRRDGVLNCSVGIAASTYLLCDRPDLAQPQLDWICRYQDVSVGGEQVCASRADDWDVSLRTKFGGCMADTTCLVGLVKVGRALDAGRPLLDGARCRDVLDSIREVFLERRLMYRSDGTVVPIGVPEAKAEDWLSPTFPLDWRTDLVEVLDLVARTGPADVRMQPALDHLAELQLDNGAWPLQRVLWPDELRHRVRRSRVRPNPMVTLRVVSALHAIRSGVE